MAITDTYVKKPTTFQIIQYSGDNEVEVSSFLAERGCNQYIAGPNGIINGDPGSSPYWVDPEMYIVLNMDTRAVAEIVPDVTGYSVQA